MDELDTYDDVETQIDVREIKRWSEIESVLEIEKQCFAEPWAVDDFREAATLDDAVILLCEVRRMVVGYGIFEFREGFATILNFAVAVDWRRQGVGRTILERIKRRVVTRAVGRLYVGVNEYHTTAQFFLKSMGFTYTEPLRYEHDGITENGYLFELNLQKAEQCQSG